MEKPRGSAWDKRCNANPKCQRRFCSAVGGRDVTCNGQRCPAPGHRSRHGSHRSRHGSCGASKWNLPGIPTSASCRGCARQPAGVPVPPCFHHHFHFSPSLSLQVSFAPIMENRVSEPVIKGCAVLRAHMN